MDRTNWFQSVRLDDFEIDRRFVETADWHAARRVGVEMMAEVVFRRKRGSFQRHKQMFLPTRTFVLQQSSKHNFDVVSFSRATQIFQFSRGVQTTEVFTWFLYVVEQRH